MKGKIQNKKSEAENSTAPAPVTNALQNFIDTKYQDELRKQILKEQMLANDELLWEEHKKEIARYEADKARGEFLKSLSSFR